MRLITVLLEQQLRRLEAMIESREVYISSLENSLSLVKVRNKTMFSSRKKGSSIRKFLDRERDAKKIIILSTKYYYERLLPLAIKRKEIIQKLLDFEKEKPLERVFNDLPDSIKEFIEPFEIPLEKRIRDFESIDYQPLETRSGNYMVKTEEGIMVRSKAEMIINDTLMKCKIPHRYEMPITVGNTVLRPDFIVLNRKTGKQYVWEHFGIMDNPVYVERFLEKLKLYEDAGYYLYDGLIATFSGKKIDEREFEMRVFSIIRGLLI